MDWSDSPHSCQNLPPKTTFMTTNKQASPKGNADLQLTHQGVQAEDGEELEVMVMVMVMVMVLVMVLD